MIRDECEMIDATDLIYPEKSQKALNTLMRDNRPYSSS